ncbi:hypothetical protein H8D91_00170 [archaeon]|nr:hypothetical protein [archaeon]
MSEREFALGDSAEYLHQLLKDAKALQAELKTIDIEWTLEDTVTTMDSVRKDGTEEERLDAKVRAMNPSPESRKAALILR